MNARTLALFVSGGLLSWSCHAQGTFQNLGFESATIVRLPEPNSDLVSFEPAFPGWSGYFGGSPATFAWYNSQPLCCSAVGLFTFGFPNQVTPIAGQYTAYLQGTVLPSFSPNVSLAQTGVVPADTMSLRFFGWSSGDNFIVSMDGQPLSVTTLQDFGNFRREYGADIAAFAGQNAELRFTQPGGGNAAGFFVLDQISFSPLAIPEPSIWALLALGSALFWRAARRGRSRK